MNKEIINVTDAKKHFSELLGRVAYGKKRILITKRGRPVARLVPVEETETHLVEAQGWLENEDPFFDVIDSILQDRCKHVSPRRLRINAALSQPIHATFQELKV